MPDAREVRAMFARVAERYDRANHVLSLGIDRLWRRATVRYAGLRPGQQVLDVCSGTGDLALTLARAGGVVTASDFCPEMLRLAESKSRRVADPRFQRPRYLAADTLNLPFEDCQFDLATVAFGIRNVRDPVAALREMARVVRPGGRIVVLEFSKPRVPLVRGAYLFYFRRVLPRIGHWISGDRGAYEYLPESVMRFPERDSFLGLMRDAGLHVPTTRELSCGIASLYRAEVAEVDR